MAPRLYDLAGHINYGPLKAHAAELRREAIDAFWAGLSSRVANWGAMARRPAALRVDARSAQRARA